MELFSFSVLAIIAVFFMVVPITVGIYRMLGKRTAPQAQFEIDHAELETAERELRESKNPDWVVLKRCHGPAYNHAAMAALVSALEEQGIPATYDVLSSSSADGGVTNYMLKVHSGTEEEAARVLAELEL